LFHYNDQVSLTLVSGSGGSGCLSFQRIKTKPRGGPSGGDGGSGGHIWLQSSLKIKSLDHLSGIKKLTAENGRNGQSQRKNGKKGKDFVLSFPVGTLVLNEQKELLYDFNTSKKILFIKGGTGGRGNAFFKTSLNQAPKKTQRGLKGAEHKITLEFKPLLDVALIGEVNSGKSSFFNQVTKGKSLVGDYPYTTLKPHLAPFRSYEKYILMDIPGLEQDAYKETRKGLSFLRSIQRAKVLLHFIDSQHRNPIKSHKKIETELKNFDKKYSSCLFQSFSQKKKFLILSRIDLLKPNELRKKRHTLQQITDKVFLISTQNQQGIKELLIAVSKEIQN